MNNFILIAISVFILVALVLLILKAIKARKNLTVKSEAQIIYENKKNQKIQAAMSQDEKIELSWKFLYDITEIVLNKFFPKDREEVHEAGAELAKNGMRYEHIVDWGIRREKHIAKADDFNIKNKGDGNKRSV